MLPEEIVQGRRASINMVLGTDMKKHFDIVSRFQVTTYLVTMAQCVQACDLSSQMDPGCNT